MTCRVVRRSRLRAEAPCVACIAGLRCVAAIFASLRCRRACWRLDANVPCGRASACLFAVLVLRGPASEKAALHSWPSNSRFNSPAFIDFGGGQGRNIPHPSHEFPTWCLILETAKVCTRNQKDGSSSSSHAKRMAQHY